MTDLDSLMAEMAGLRAKVDRLSFPPIAPNSVSDGIPKPTNVVPFWDGTFAKSLTLTQGINDDWDPRFDSTAATDRIRFHVATAHGFFDTVDYGTDNQRRFKISWDAAMAGTVSAIIMGGLADSGWVQVKMNGVIVETFLDSPGGALDGKEYLSLQVKEGRNQLVISVGALPDTLHFAGVLWDETRGDSWVDPRGLEGYFR